MKSFKEYKYDYGSPESVKLMKKVTPGQKEAINWAKAGTKARVMHPITRVAKKVDKKDVRKYVDAGWLHMAQKKNRITKEAMTPAQKAEHDKAIAAFKAKGGKIKKLKPGYAQGYHGKDDPGSGMRGMLDKGDSKAFGTRKKIKSMGEAIKDPGEYDEEGLMMKDQLDIVMDAADDIYDTVSDNENLPEWCQNKITKAADYIDSVRDYLKSQKTTNEGSGPSMGDLQKRANIKQSDKDKLLKIRQMLDKEKKNRPVK